MIYIILALILVLIILVWSVEDKEKYDDVWLKTIGDIDFETPTYKDTEYETVNSWIQPNTNGYIEKQATNDKLKVVKPYVTRYIPSHNFCETSCMTPENKCSYDVCKAKCCMSICKDAPLPRYCARLCL